MKTLIETTDLSLVESLRVALEGEGIDAQVFDIGVASLPFIPMRVQVLDEDYGAAESMLKTLQRTPAVSETPPAVRHTFQVVLALLAILGIVCLLL